MQSKTKSLLLFLAPFPFAAMAYAYLAAFVFNHYEIAWGRGGSSQVLTVFYLVVALVIFLPFAIFVWARADSLRPLRAFLSGLIASVLLTAIMVAIAVR